MEMEYSAGLAITYNNMILLGHPTNSSWFGSYSIPKGGIEIGESILDAAIRETKEELGINVKKSLIDFHEHSVMVNTKSGKPKKIIYYYVVSLTDLSQIGLTGIKVPKQQLQLKEMDWAGMLSYNDAIKRISKSQLPILNHLMNLGLLENRLQDYKTFLKNNL
jgi:predicted NUDIX family NTP pyrophosphohydrolase